MNIKDLNPVWHIIVTFIVRGLKFPKKKKQICIRGFISCIVRSKSFLWLDIKFCICISIHMMVLIFIYLFQIYDILINYITVKNTQLQTEVRTLTHYCYHFFFYTFQYSLHAVVKKVEYWIYKLYWYASCLHHVCIMLRSYNFRSTYNPTWNYEIIKKLAPNSSCYIIVWLKF